MPILAAEPECFPDSLWSDQDQRAENSELWWVAQTRPRQEKCLARHLHAAQIGHYLPTISRRRNVRGRVRTARLPLFPGYVFLLAVHQQRFAALTSNRIVRCLPVNDQRRLWNDLWQIRQLINSGLPITPEARISVGTPVEITSGPLTGLHGIVERLANGHRFYVQIDFIEKGASVLIDDFALTPIGSRPPLALKKWQAVSATFTHSTDRSIKRPQLR